MAPEKRPMERVLGPEMGDFVRSLHEEHGVIFHLGDTVDRDRRQARHAQERRHRWRRIWSWSASACGRAWRSPSRPASRSIAASSSNAYLETSVAGIFAAGDIARWPDPHSGENIRVEHWVVAERQGQTAARNMLGQREAFDAVPFFWSQHYDVPINYVGHAEKWDEIAVDGDIAARDCLLRYKRRDACWRWPRSTAISQASRPSLRWSRTRRSERIKYACDAAEGARTFLTERGCPASCDVTYDVTCLVFLGSTRFEQECKTNLRSSGGVTCSR